MNNRTKRLLCLLLALTMIFALAACEQDKEQKETTVPTGETVAETEEGTLPEETTASVPVETEPQQVTEETVAETEPVEEVLQKPEDPQKALIGTWTSEINMSQYLCDSMSMEIGLDVYVDSLNMVMEMTFNEDGTCVVGLDASKLEEGFEDLVDEIWDAIIDMAAEEAGVPAAMIKITMAAQGMTKEVLFEELSVEELFGELEGTFTGKWTLTDDQLTIIADDVAEDSAPVTIECIHENDFHITKVADSEESISDNLLSLALLPLIFLRK